MRATRSQDVLTVLANEIVAGVISPGQRLDEQAIADRFMVSRTPVREALRQLSGMGLIEKRPKGGVMAAQIEVAQLADMFETMGELEGVCARLSAMRMSEIERHQLKVLVEQGQRAAESNDVNEYARINEAFHELIYHGAHNDSIRSLTMSFRQRLAPFRVPSTGLPEGRMHSSIREHHEIATAVANRNAEQTLQAMRVHVASSSASVIDHFAKMRAGSAPGRNFGGSMVENVG